MTCPQADAGSLEHAMAELQVTDRSIAVNGCRTACVLTRSPRRYSQADAGLQKDAAKSRAAGGSPNKGAPAAGETPQARIRRKSRELEESSRAVEPWAGTCIHMRRSGTVCNARRSQEMCQKVLEGEGSVAARPADTNHPLLPACMNSCGVSACDVCVTSVLGTGVLVSTLFSCGGSSAGLSSHARLDSRTRSRSSATLRKTASRSKGTPVRMGV